MRRTLAIALGVGAAALAAAGPRAAGTDEIAAVESTKVRFVDAVPQGPSVAARLGEIRRRIQAALVYPPLARMQRVEGETLLRFAKASILGDVGRG